MSDNAVCALVVTLMFLVVAGVCGGAIWSEDRRQARIVHITDGVFKLVEQGKFTKEEGEKLKKLLDKQ